MIVGNQGTNIVAEGYNNSKSFGLGGRDEKAVV
jgi:hypothetical protein